MQVAETRDLIVVPARNSDEISMTGITTEAGSVAVAGEMDEAGMTAIVTETRTGVLLAGPREVGLEALPVDLLGGGTVT